MDKILEFLKGKKTYIIAVAILVLGGLQGLGIFTVPEWAWTVLGAFGLAFLRSGVTSISDKIKEIP